MLGQVDGNGIRCRLCKNITLLGNGLGEELGHAVELRFYAVQALGDGDRVVEDGVRAVVGVGFVGGLELVEAEDFVDEGLFGMFERWRR